MVNKNPNKSFLQSSQRRRKCSGKEVDFEYKEFVQEDEEYERQQLIVEIAKEIKPQHPISYDAFNLCEYAQEKKNFPNLMWQC